MRPDQKLMHQGLRAVASAIVILTAHGPTWAADAQTPLADPTMPPLALRKAGTEALAPSNNGGSAIAATNQGSDAPSRMPRLQSIYMDPRSGQANVMLDGQIRHAGERSGAWTVQDIDSDSVTLRGASGTVRMNLLGGHNKLKQRPGTKAALPQKEQP